MSAFAKSCVLFTLNLLDAQLTILWVRAGVASEGNGLMARLLEAGDAPFLLTKLAVGALVAYTLCRFSHLTLARKGLSFVLGLYVALMFVHASAFTSWLGWHAPESLIAYVSALPDGLLSLLS
ncbi:MAG TPA: DUF5658 family protein [Pyrinomonadaceae bacterium]|nr:DUF5658 family protein [Pyrinomonadaceae bacterium]